MPMSAQVWPSVKEANVFPAVIFWALQAQTSTLPKAIAAVLSYCVQLE